MTYYDIYECGDYICYVHKVFTDFLIENGQLEIKEDGNLWETGLYEKEVMEDD